ncbi:hypothetical protein CISG_10252 [Coccidioides immitis RMSCC 3703]|uniref:Uncharacterized protein n=1 Tax=Coccidioides immitis RMSCC 3703 TaxID=454286 RepID=A0A0J8QNL6_COCIT|nr:hypothetical protein CISG_10252 [Coccidioides immitis RMSCC 3703]
MAAFQLGKGTYIDKEGEYLINIPSMETEVPHLSDGQDSMICMTSAQDVARAVVAALDLPRWPREFRMFGDRMSLTGLVGTVESVFGCEFKTSFISVESLCYLLSQAEASGDVRKQRRLEYSATTISRMAANGLGLAPNFQCLPSPSPSSSLNLNNIISSPGVGFMRLKGLGV